MNDVQQSILMTKMPTIRQRPIINDGPTVHLTKLERGLLQRSLLYCFEKGYFSLIRYLLESGSADACERDCEGRNGLMYCCFVDNDSWAQNIAMTLLEHGAKIEHQDRRGLNALHYAIITQRLVLVRRYASSIDFDLSRTTDIYGNTCLHYACSTGNTEIVRCILDVMKRYSIDLTSKNHYNLTAYDITCALKHERCQNLLRNEITLRERYKQTPTSRKTSAITLKSLVERRTSIPSRVRSVTSTTNHTESVTSVPVCILSSKNCRNHEPTSIDCYRENVAYPPPIFVDPIELHRIKLRRNESLDLTLANQVKNRPDFVVPSFASSSSSFSSPSLTWRDEFSKVFNQLQSYKTPSYRKTVHAPMSAEYVCESPDILSDCGEDIQDNTHQQSTSSFRTSLSQKMAHRRRSSMTSSLLAHKTKK